MFTKKKIIAAITMLSIAVGVHFIFNYLFDSGSSIVPLIMSSGYLLFFGYKEKKEV